MENMIIKNSKGEDVDYTVLLTFDIEEKSYVIYTTPDFAETANVYYASYSKENNSKLEEVTDERIIAIIEDIIKDLEKVVKNNKVDE